MKIISFKRIKEIFLENKKKLATAGILLLTLIIICGIFSWNKFHQKNLTIGIITDIHAGSQDLRDEGVEPNNILIPANFENNVGTALKKMKKCDLIITLGDNLNTPSQKYLDELKKITKGYPIAWTKGNHDKRDLFEKYFANPSYYYIDKKNWRIIILDNSESFPDHHGDDFNNHGYISPEQLQWLKNSLKTDKKILIAMHVPMLDRNNLNNFRDDQQYLAKIFEESGNVKYVFAGHYHVYDWHTQINGIDYYILPSISLKDHEGFYFEVNLEQ